MQKILKIQILIKHEAFLLGTMDKSIKKQFGTLFLYMVTVVRIVFAKHWKEKEMPTAEEWILKID